MKPLTGLQGAGIGVVLMALIIGALELCRKFKKRSPLSPGGARIQRVSRRVTAVDARDWNNVRVDLECGHIVNWQMVVPNSCECPYCTAEVAQLKKIAGEK